MRKENFYNSLGENMEVTKKDWKLFREKIGDWQESYIKKLLDEYIKMISDGGLASDKFLELDKRIKADRRKPGVIIEMRKSEMLYDIVALINDKVITQDDLEEFSDELKEYVNEGGKAGIVIGDQTIPVDKDGNIAGGLKAAGFRPYLGVGFGRAVPKKRIGVQFELGVQFHGTPKVYTDAGILGSTSTDGDDSFTKIIDKLTVYPVMKLRFCGRLF